MTDKKVQQQDELRAYGWRRWAMLMDPDNKNGTAVIPGKKVESKKSK